jgi:hypothetical protein
MDEMKMLRLLEGVKLGGLKYSPPEITKAHAVVYQRGLKDFSDEEIKEACLYVMTNEKEFPSVARIKEICLGQTKSVKEVGQDVATLIEKNISSWGSWWPDHAKKSMGDLAWEVVQRCGGWNFVCDISLDQLPSCKKQWREVAESLSKGYITNGHNKPPQIPRRSAVPAFLLE